MQSKIIIAAALATVVSAQSTTAEAAAPAPTSGSAGAGGSMNPNAINVPEGGLPAAAVGKPWELSWTPGAAPADKPIVIVAVGGDSMALKTYATLATAASNQGAATIVWPKNVPPTAGVAILEAGVEPNYSNQFPVQGGNADAVPIGANTTGGASATGSATGSAEETATPSATESGNPSTMETVTGSASEEPSESATGSSQTGGSSSQLPTESQSGGSASRTSTASTTSASSAAGASAKFSSVAFIGGLVAALFAL